MKLKFLNVIIINVVENMCCQYVVIMKDDIIMQWLVKNVLRKTGLKNIVKCVDNLYKKIDKYNIYIIYIIHYILK